MTFAPFPEEALDRSAADRFATIAARHAGRLAVRDASRSLTYAELAAEVDGIAAALGGVSGEGPVALYLPLDASCAAAMLAALAAGRPFVVLDASHLDDRNRLIAEDAAAEAVVTTRDLAGRAAALVAGRPVIDVGALPQGAPLGTRATPDMLAWITYTSGSTGRPKGVFQNHRGLVNDMAEAVNSLRLAPDDRQALFNSPGFVSGMRLVLSTLLSGGSLHMMPATGARAMDLVARIRDEGITVIRTVPTLFREIAGAVPPGARLDALRLVAIGGEPVTWADYDLFRRIAPEGAEFVTHLGATECSTIYLQWTVDPVLRDRHARLPLGRVLSGRVVDLVGEDGAPVAEGEAGEFAVSSPHLALGYWRDPEATARAFAANPARPGFRTYRTGDLGRPGPDGLYEFAGRKDRQVKINGQRIELEEVERALGTCNGIRGAAAVIRRDAVGRPRAIVAYVELQPGLPPMLPRHVMAMASRALPAAMMPAMAVIVDDLPRLANRKLDRTRLDALEGERESALGAAGDALVMAVMQMFEAVVPGTRATPDDNLWSIGGNSLQAVELALELEKRFGVKIPAETFRATESIADLAGWIGERMQRNIVDAEPVAG